MSTRNSDGQSVPLLRGKSQVRALPGASFPPYTPDWTKVSTSTGYRVVYCPDHPRAWSTGYVYVHQVVAEMKLGRLLEDGEVCHHKDEDKLNNSPENIEVTTKSAHSREHGRHKTRAMVRLGCPQCGTVFVKETRQTHLRKPSRLGATCCSRSCRGKLSRRIQMEGVTESTLAALDANVIEHFRE